MSYWDSNSKRPFNGGQNSYHEATYNTNYNITAPYVKRNGSYNNYAPYNEVNNVSLHDSRSNYGMGETYTSISSDFNASNFMQHTMPNESPTNISFDKNPQSSLAINSNLTPLAKEFTPGRSYYEANGSNSRKQGAVKKGTYWNKERHFYDTNKRQNNDYTHRNRTFYPNNQNAGNSKDFTKSSEQNKVLQDTKKFLQQVNVQENSKNVTDISENQNFIKNVSRNFNNKEFDDFRQQEHNYNSKSNKSSGYYKNTNSNRNRNSYKRDYYDFDIRNKEQVYERRYRNGEFQSFEKKRYDSDVSKAEPSKQKPNEAYGKKDKLDNLKKKLDAASQRERLEQLILRRLLECLVCCEKLRPTDQIWSCKQCYHILHLNCTIKWAQSSKLESGWRCPACQNVYQDEPKDYKCYCEKQIQPTLDPGGIPHSCGSICGRKGRSCLHTCTLICHPGPCPDCTVMVPRSCGCGATKPIVKCSSSVAVTCQKICNKILNCNIHYCTSKCHEGDCEPCGEILQQECYCGKEGQKVNCTQEVNGELLYECGGICDQLLSCGNHKCEQKCHKGVCNTCSKSPSETDTCPCGQTKLVNERKSCLDPIPCCDKVCSKILQCGQPSAPHKCNMPCHEGLCGPCPKTTMIRCRCGHMDKEILCTKLTTKADDARCEKKCIKKRLCGKHKCNQFCCIEVDHVCPLPCNRLLSCGQHKCAEPCHKGRCSPCWRTSFEELYCECGSSVLYPPVACGTRPPPCDQICSRVRSCSHGANHPCHPGPCPPCAILTKRWCHGKHEQRSTIPCHQSDFSCGLPCGKEMPCGKHKCVQICHKGSCRTSCIQPCAEPRNLCGHPCNLPCHAPPCPETPCKQPVQVTCQCGLRKGTRICIDLSAEYQNIAMAQLSSKLEQIQQGNTVDITDLVSGQKRATLKILDCNEECRLIERNRRLAIGLQIRNPDLSSKLTPRYSDYMRAWAKKDPKFCQYIHEKLTELVQLAKQSKQKSRAYSFETMNRDKRHFVHEYCEHFGCDSAAYDPEPNRNVVATAYKDKSWLPSYSLLQVIQRESGQRKVPGPQQLGKGSTSKTETVSLKLPGRIPRAATPPGEYVDYFNNPPE